MNIAEILQQRLQDSLSPKHLVIENESHMHSGPATESHFKVTLVADGFAGKRLVQRHQMIFTLMADYMNNPIHALSMHLFTPDEWQAKGETVMDSPKCLGGSK